MENTNIVGKGGNQSAQSRRAAMGGRATNQDDELDFDSRDSVEPPLPEDGKFGRRYPWGEWFALGKFRLVRGTHYNGRSDTMGQQIRNSAQKAQYNYRVKIRIAEDGNSLVVLAAKL